MRRLVGDILDYAVLRRAIDRADRHSARFSRASRFAVMASRYGALASRSIRVIAAGNSPTMVIPRLVRTGRTSN